MEKTANEINENFFDEKKRYSILEKFFVDELKEIYWVEQHLVKIVPKLSFAVTTEELNQVFNDHLDKAREHVARLEHVFNIIGETIQAKKSDVMDALSKEVLNIIEATKDNTLIRDVSLIFVAQKIAHYKILAYVGLVQLAKTLGCDDAADVLKITLNEERNADKLLTSIAEDYICQSN
jgi:ferritin-like metal-binding protein YciE